MVVADCEEDVNLLLLDNMLHVRTDTTESFCSVKDT